MDFILSSLSPEIAETWLSQAARSDLASYLIVVAVVWKVMGNKVSSHFKSIESGLAGVAQEVANLRGAVQADLKIQVERLDGFERTVLGISERVEKIEEIVIKKP